jgi:putative copper resistance protein D
MTVFSNEDLWRQANGGDDAPLKKAMTSIIAVQSVEAAGFVVLIVCMLLLS